MKEEPEIAEGWRLLGSMHAELGNDMAAVATLKKAARMAPKSNAPVELLALLMERARYRVSARLADHLEKTGANGNRFYGLLAKIVLLQGQADRALEIIDKAEAEDDDAELSPNLEMLKKIALSRKAEIERGNSMENTRHIAVCGVSHVGSTIFGTILGAVEGLGFAGETHALTEVKMFRWGGKGRMLIATDIPESKWPGACRVCGRQCEVYNREFRLWLANNPTGKYAHIAKHLGVQTLVTSDKNVELYFERDPLFRFDQLILYKSPEAQLRSTLKIDLKAKPDAATEFHRQVPELLSRWTTIYHEHLHLIRPTGQKILINWEALVADPERHFKRLSELLGINLTMSTLVAPHLGHFIGGNTGVDVAKIRAAGRIELRTSNAPPLPVDAKNAADAHKASQRIFGILEKRYRDVFG